MNKSIGGFPQPLFAIVLLALFAAGSAESETGDRVLDDAEWRADIELVASTIRDVHPRPFRTITGGEFDTAASQLSADVPKLTDKEIIVRLAALVALVDDGHTRLALPRKHPEIGLEFGHSPTPGPEYPELRLRQLPIAFEHFSDGVFVVASDAPHKDLIGLRLVSIDGTPAAEAMAAVQAITFAENDQLDRLMGVDRLTLPEALRALGIADSEHAVTLELANKDGHTTTIDLEPLSSAQFEWTGAFTAEPVPLRIGQPGRKFWAEYVPDGNFVYMQMDEIGDDDIPLAEFVVNTLQMAVTNDARLVIDVRNNFGGSGGLNRTLVTSIISSDELNRRDRTFVLIGRRTFSAAQMLVNELEQYTRVTFVGEPTGSRPDHFGDPKKIRLDNSGLTLRVSRLHWSSYTAFDERESTNPDFLVKWSSSDYFAGRDPALDYAVSADDVSLKTLLREAFARGDLQQVARYTLDSKLSAATYRDNFAPILIELGNEFESTGQLEIASLAYRVGLYFYPDHDGLKQALENLPSGS